MDLHHFQNKRSNCFSTYVIRISLWRKYKEIKGILFYKDLQKNHYGTNFTCKHFFMSETTEMCHQVARDLSHESTFYSLIYHSRVARKDSTRLSNISSHADSKDSSTVKQTLRSSLLFPFYRRALIKNVAKLSSV